MKSPAGHAARSGRLGRGSQFGQDDYLDDVVFQRRRHGVFLDLGGFDGVTGSNSLRFESERGWTGWLLEPDPDLCDRARANRECVCLEVAIAPSDGQASFWRPTSTNRRMMGGLSEMIRPHHLELMRSEPTHAEETIEVVTISPRTLVQQIGVDRIDFVSLDIEGAERAVLASFPFDDVAVGAWSIENLEGTGDIEELMRHHGFALVRRLGVDEIYIPQDQEVPVRARTDVSPFDEAADLLEAGFCAHSLAAHRPLIAAMPDDPHVWNNLGLSLAGVGDHDQALDAHRRAVELDPSHNLHRRNLQRILIELDCHHEAMSVGVGTAGATAQDLALTEQSRFELAYRAGKTGEALAAVHRWAVADPGSSKARFAEAEVRLADGQLSAGWECYEARSATERNEGLPIEGVPEWRGESLAGRRLLVLGEQGLGDQVFFSRFVPSVAPIAAGTTVAAPPPLRRLFEGAGDVVTSLDEETSLDAFDCWVRIGSIPHLTDSSGYVEPRRFRPPEAAKIRARDVVGPSGDGVRRAGIVWSGQAKTAHQRARHVPLSALRPVFEIPDVDWFSLAKGPMTDDLVTCGLEDRIVDAGTSDRDLADTAAVCAELDFVVTVCTVTAHLAASMAVPTFVLLHHRPFWVWGHHRATTPWYPSARIIRQTKAGDWAPVVDRLYEVIADG